MLLIAAGRVGQRPGPGVRGPRPRRFGTTLPGGLLEGLPEALRVAGKLGRDVDQRHALSGVPQAGVHQGHRGYGLDQGLAYLAVIAALEQALRPSRGGRCAVAIRYAGQDAAAHVVLGEEWRVKPSQDLIERLGQILGRDGVELVYAPRVDG